jgi:hypothetical protein
MGGLLGEGISAKWGGGGRGWISTVGAQEIRRRQGFRVPEFQGFRVPILQGFGLGLFAGEVRKNS